MWLWFWMAEIGTPAAIRPITGTAIGCVRPPRRCAGSGSRRPAEIALDHVRPEAALARAGEARIDGSGSRITSSARARFGSRRMKPRSSSAGDQAVDARLRPQVERVLHLVEGRGNAVSFSRSLMNRSSSSCFRVSMVRASGLVCGAYKSRTDILFMQCSASIYEEASGYSGAEQDHGTVAPAGAAGACGGRMTRRFARGEGRQHGRILTGKGVAIQPSVAPLDQRART